MISQILFSIWISYILKDQCQLPKSINDIQYKVETYREYRTNRIIERDILRFKGQYYVLIYKEPDQLLECKQGIILQEIRAYGGCSGLMITNRLLRKGQFIKPALKPDYCSIEVKQY
jgi:hypothetical protein